MRRSDFIDAMTRHFESYVGLLEGQGPNRSAIIDDFNKFIGAPMGSPYCLSALLYVINALSEAYNFRIDLPLTGHCLSFANKMNKEYKFLSPNRGDIGIYRMAGTSSGHAVYVKEVMDDKFIKTIEFNTGPQDKMNRDGDGCYEKERKILGAGNMTMLCFVRVPLALRFVDGPLFD